MKSQLEIPAGEDNEFSARSIETLRFPSRIGMHGTKHASFPEDGIPAMPIDDFTSSWPDAVRAGIGHNGGPPLEKAREPNDWNGYCWRRAHQRAWKTPPREVALRRLRRAEELGMTYREYQAVILDRGVYL